MKDWPILIAIIVTCLACATVGFIIGGGCAALEEADLSPTMKCMQCDKPDFRENLTMMNLCLYCSIKRDHAGTCYRTKMYVHPECNVMRRCPCHGEGWLPPTRDSRKLKHPICVTNSPHIVRPNNPIYTDENGKEIRITP